MCAEPFFRSEIGHVVFGHVINTEPRDMYLSRAAAMEAGVPESFNVLVKEVRGLGLNMELLDVEGDE